MKHRSPFAMNSESPCHHDMNLGESNTDLSTVTNLHLIPCIYAAILNDQYLLFHSIRHSIHLNLMNGCNGFSYH